MPKLIISLVLILFFYLPVKMSGATQLPDPCLICEDSTTRVLVLIHKYKDKQSVLVTGASIRYRLYGKKGRKRGIIRGFTEDAILIDGQPIKLETIHKIKKVDSFGIALLKILGVLIIGGSIFFGTAIGVYAAGGGVVNIILILLGSALGISLGALASSTNSMKNLAENYEARIYEAGMMDIAVEQLK